MVPASEFYVASHRVDAQVSVFWIVPAGSRDKTRQDRRAARETIIIRQVALIAYGQATGERVSRSFLLCFGCRASTVWRSIENNEREIATCGNASAVGGQRLGANIATNGIKVCISRIPR